MDSGQRWHPLSSDIRQGMHDYSIAPSDNYTGDLTDIVVGSGTTAPEITDYKLESFLYSELEFCSSSITFEDGTFEKLGTITLSKTMRNKSENTISINEIGIVGNGHYSYNGRYYYCYYLLVYREVLDTPIEVASGHSFTVTIKINPNITGQYLKNYYNIIMNRLFFTGNNEPDKLARYKLINGTLLNSDRNGYIPVALLLNSQDYPATTTITNYFGDIILGTGTTPVSPTDYCLEAPIPAASFQGLSQRVAWAGSVTRGRVRSYFKTIKNITSDPITIHEIGMVTAINGQAALIYREVLENPLTIPPDQEAQISIDFQTIGEEF